MKLLNIPKELTENSYYFEVVGTEKELLNLCDITSFKFDFWEEFYDKFSLSFYCEKNSFLANEFIYTKKQAKGILINEMKEARRIK